MDVGRNSCEILNDFLRAFRLSSSGLSATRSSVGKPENEKMKIYAVRD